MKPEEEVTVAMRRLLAAELGHKVDLQNCDTKEKVFATIQNVMNKRPVQDAVAGVYHRARLQPPRSQRALPASREGGSAY